MVTRPVVLALVLVMGCADRQGDRQGGAIAADHVGATMPTVTITKAGERPGRPPLIRLLVNVTAANPGPDQRWVVIQRNIPGDDGGGVDKLEQLAAGGVAIGKFLGTGGFYAVALAPGARLTIKNLEIGWWNGDRAMTPPPIEVTTAAGVTLGGADIATWFAGDPAVSGTVEVDADTAQNTASHRADGDKEVAVEVTGGHPERIPVE